MPLTYRQRRKNEFKKGKTKNEAIDRKLCWNRKNSCYDWGKSKGEGKKNKPRPTKECETSDGDCFIVGALYSEDTTRNQRGSCFIYLS